MLRTLPAQAPTSSQAVRKQRRICLLQRRQTRGVLLRRTRQQTLPIRRSATTAPRLQRQVNKGNHTHTIFCKHVYYRRTTETLSIPTGGSKMKTKNCSNSTTKNCNGSNTKARNTTAKNCKNKTNGGATNCGKNTRNNSDSESDSDPFGSYTGNPSGFGKYAEPVQDADDL